MPSTHCAGTSPSPPYQGCQRLLVVGHLVQQHYELDSQVVACLDQLLVPLEQPQPVGWRLAATLPKLVELVEGTGIRGSAAKAFARLAQHRAERVMSIGFFSPSGPGWDNWRRTAPVRQTGKIRMA